jgi:hypothetical protein
MPVVTFTKYTQPDGRRSQIQLPISEEAFPLAEALRMQGYVFEIEVLPNGIISQTVTDDDDDIEIELCGPGGQEAARIELITRAHALVFKNPARPRKAR